MHDDLWVKERLWETSHDYAVLAPVCGEAVGFIKAAESFDAELLDVIDRLTNEKRESFRKKLKTLMREAGVEPANAYANGS